MTDPWSVQNTNDITPKAESLSEVNSQNTTDTQRDFLLLGFEDSFLQDSNSNSLVADTNKDAINKVIGTEHKPLPDSESYLQGLERKLDKLKKNSKLLDALSEKRDDCLRSMLQNNISSFCNNDLLLELDASVNNSDSAVQNLYRQLQPVQPVTVGETVHIVKYDQLEEQRIEAESKEELEENLPASR